MVVPYGGVDTGRLLTEAMKVARESHRMIANNIANADTPHYNPRELNFQATLKNAMEGRGRVSLRKTQPQHLDMAKGAMGMERYVKLSKNDYNKVDLDDQVVKLSENTGKYVMYETLLAKRFEMARNMLSSIR